MVAEARRSGVEVVSLDVDDLDDLHSTFDDLHPVIGKSIDVALVDVVDALQREGRIVAVLSTAAPQALSAADVAVGVMRRVPRRRGMRTCSSTTWLARGGSCTRCPWPAR